MISRQHWRFATWFVTITLGTLVLLGAATVVALSWAQTPLPATLATLAVITGLLTVAVAIIVDRVVMYPVQRLARAARRLTAGHLQETIRVEGPAEVGDLAAAFNEMAAQLREEMDALTVERNRATAVLSTMTDGIVIVDGQSRVQLVNEAARRLLRLDGAAASGGTLAAVVRDHELQQTLATALAGGAAHSAVVRLAPPSSERRGDPREAPRYVRATGIPIPGGQHAADPVGLLVLQDVTELRRSEAIRREFVANVSHELRTPLASLKALAETLEEGALDDPPAAREFLGQMHVEVDSLAQLVQELLELSRIESGQIALRVEAVPAAGLAEDAETRLRMQAERAGVAILLEAPPDLPTVRADPARIGQVLINLLHNAVKFTPAGGGVTLRIAPDPEGMRFSVADTGIGIAPENLPRLFERFYKVDRSRASGGTGLGLAIAKHIVQAHGGRIWAESAGEGQGATFSFILPLAAAPRATGDGRSVPDAASSPVAAAQGAVTQP
ncbi:MAG: HAMP domain-containing sensor histidine kinase [Chloroflexota bacterium]